MNLSQLTKIVIMTSTILPVIGLSKRTGGIFNNMASREVLKTWEIIINNIIYYKTNTEKQRLVKKYKNKQGRNGKNKNQ